ncbi:MAG TPA: VIT domain-containing protein [Candidatus Ozemobacteraceae bacterium]|nr:VIT domain-containing protein [Candidatus Ozemobacteraceae bacterium]
MRNFLLLLVLTVLTVPVFAQVGPRIMLDDSFKGEKIELRQVSIETRLAGHVAETRMTMAFHNPGSRNLAGDLVFPLPEGAAVSGYALDVNGVLVDGVAVEKEKARVVFEKEMRKGVDPGLVEQVGGNTFKTRVFPIPPRGTRTIRVSYVSEPSNSGTKSQFLIPVRFGKIDGPRNDPVA